MTEMNNNGFDPSHLMELGLYRKGEHQDNTVIATGPEGKSVTIQVYPLTVKNGEGTMFIPVKGQSEKLKVLFPRSSGGNPLFGNK